MSVVLVRERGPPELFVCVVAARVQACFGSVRGITRSRTGVKRCSRAARKAPQRQYSQLITPTVTVTERERESVMIRAILLARLALSADARLDSSAAPLATATSTVTIGSNDHWFPSSP